MGLFKVLYSNPIAHLGLFEAYDFQERKITLRNVVKIYPIIPDSKLAILQFKKDSAISNTYQLNHKSFIYARESIITFFSECKWFSQYADMIRDPVQRKKYPLLDDLFFEKSKKFSQNI